eukprot:g10376.t1
MVRVRGLFLLAFGLATSPTCRALLPPSSLPRTAAGNLVAARSSHVSQIAAWRGGAVESSGGQPPVMSLKLGLVRVAGYGIIAGSFCLKTPQIARVWKAKSLVGLAPASIYADVFLFATSVMYHVLKRNPIRAYGESVIVLFQTLTMVCLLWCFGTDEEVVVAGGSGDGGGEEPTAVTKTKNHPAGGGPVGRAAIVGGSVAATVLCMKYLPERLWGLLVVVSTPALLAVQLPQIWKNWRQKHTGELATLTVFLACLGSSIRVGTTIADLGGDPWLLFNYVLGATSNATMLIQIYLYRARTAIVRRGVEAKTHGSSPPA